MEFVHKMKKKIFYFDLEEKKQIYGCVRELKSSNFISKFFFFV
jgi:hypothetical protein